MAINHELKELTDRLYEQYCKPLERQHLGEYVAISAEGRRVIGPELLEVAKQARSVLVPYD